MQTLPEIRRERVLVTPDLSIKEIVEKYASQIPAPPTPRRKVSSSKTTCRNRSSLTGKTFNRVTHIPSPAESSRNPFPEIPWRRDAETTQSLQS